MTPEKKATKKLDATWAVPGTPLLKKPILEQINHVGRLQISMAKIRSSVFRLAV